MKAKLFVFVFLFLAGSIIPNLLFAQFTQQGPKLVATDGTTNSEQGSSVAISTDGNTAIVGGFNDNNPAGGAAFVFTRSGGVWTQQGSKLIGTGTVGNSQQGYSVGISSDGNTAIIGGPGDNSSSGAVWIFTRSSGVWTQQGSKLIGTGTVGNSQQGISVAISSDGNTVVTGGNLDNNHTGAVWIFTRSGGIWTQQGPKLVGIGSVGSPLEQGWSVDISSDGNTAILGCPLDNSLTGAVWVFTRSGGVWTQQGPKLVGTGAVGSSVRQGWSVSVSSDGNTAIEGGPYDDVAGAVWIFTRSGGVWTQQGQKLIGTGAVGNAYQGVSVSIFSDGNAALVGGNWDNSQRGAVWIFTRSGGVWTQQGQKLVGTGAVGNSFQGWSTAISSDGQTAIVGGYLDRNFRGAAWVFVSSGTGITPISTEVPKQFSLSQNYPNPFNPSTTIHFSVGTYGYTSLRVLNLLGQEVATLVNENLQPGSYQTTFSGEGLASGVYFYRLTSGGQSLTKKLLLTK